MSRTLGGGNFGPELRITMVPDSTFKSELDTLIKNSTTVAGKKLVSLTWSNNYEVTSPASDAIFDGRIFRLTEIKASPYYYLTVDLISYLDQNGNRHTPRYIMHLPYYSGSLALQDSVIIKGDTYMKVHDGGTGGWGAVIAIDVPSGYADVIF